MHSLDTVAHPTCVLIPSRGRPEILLKNLKKMPFLDHASVCFGFEKDEKESYRGVLKHLRRASRVFYHNDIGSAAVARENLRQWAVAQDYKYAVVTDDNAAYSKMSLENLIRATQEFPIQPCIMAGMHNVAKHFDRHRIPFQQSVNGLTSYAQVAMIFQCYPMSLYRAYQYPRDAYGLDDRHFFLWAIAQGIKEFRVCMDAPFTKTRYQPGGQGPVEDRMEKCGKAIARLATDFPKLVGAEGTLRIPWQFLLSVEFSTASRLVGGSMRKGVNLGEAKKGKKKVMVKVNR